MAEGSRKGGREGEAGGSEWFARELGDTWVEVEPGIYERRPAPETPEPADADTESLPGEPPPFRRRAGA